MRGTPTINQATLCSLCTFGTRCPWGRARRIGEIALLVPFHPHLVLHQTLTSLHQTLITSIGWFSDAEHSKRLGGVAQCRDQEMRPGPHLPPLTQTEICVSCLVHKTRRAHRTCCCGRVYFTWTVGKVFFVDYRTIFVSSTSGVFIHVSRDAVRPCTHWQFPFKEHKENIPRSSQCNSISVHSR